MENNYENIPIVEQPENLKIKLFPHQLAAIYQMESREDNNLLELTDSYIKSNIGIYADITGYGKTSSLVGLIVRDKMKWNKEEIYEQTHVTHIYGNGRITKYKTFRHDKINTNLILASQSLIAQWEEECSFTTLKVFSITTRKKANSCNPREYDIIICSPTMYNYFISRFKNIAWKRFIYDEPTHTKIPSMHSITAGFTWFVTATPNMLLHIYRSSYCNFLHSIFAYYMSTALFNKLIVKNPDDFVKKSYVLPETNHINHECYQPLYNMVRGFINNNILELISAGDIQGAVQSLGGNSTNNIVDLTKKHIQEKIEECNWRVARYTRRGNNEMAEEWNKKKIRYQNQIEELKNRFKDALNGNCTICYEKLKKTIVLTCCHNMFCGECILKWLEKKNTCPLCRSKINKDSIIYLQNENENENNSTPVEKKLTKNEMIVKLIQDNKEGKFIIFSSHDETFNIIRNTFLQMKIEYGEVRGRASTRRRKINDFKNGKIRVIFLNSKNNGAGINLQEATDIILYHEMNNDLETQIIGRANRIGRKTTLKVHHLI